MLKIINWNLLLINKCIIYSRMLYVLIKLKGNYWVNFLIDVPSATKYFNFLWRAPLVKKKIRKLLAYPYSSGYTVQAVFGIETTENIF